MNAISRDDTGDFVPEEVSGAPDDQTTEETDVEPFPLSQVFGILSNARRRRVLRVLHDCGGASTLSNVAERIAAWENDKEVSELTSSERKRTYVGLYQCHLPKMDDSDVIEFDKHRGDVRLGPRAPRLFEYLDDEEETETRPWAMYYLALASSWGGVFLIGLVAEVSLLASPVVVGLQLLSFLACSLLHYGATVDDDRDGSLRSLVDRSAGST